MLQHTLATMASEFATAIVRALRSAPMDELRAFLETSAQRTPALRAAVAAKPAETKPRVGRGQELRRPVTSKAKATTRPSKPVRRPSAAKADMAEAAAPQKAPIAELPTKVAAEPKPRKAAAAKAAGAPKAPEATAPTTRKRAREKTPEARPELSSSILDAIVAFYVERATRGATERQVASHLEGLGLDTNVSTAAVEALVANGKIRDAGFRRAAGRNATAPVYVANPPSGSSSPSFG
ncbi:MAG: hypothetical protein U0183_32945 [Polyangiaceae bacterium]